MKINDRLKEIHIKNGMSYYFDNMSKIENFEHFFLIDKKSNENFLVCNISYKNLIAVNLLHIRFDKTDEFIRVYYGTRCLVLFECEKDDSIYNKIRYLLSVKSGIKYVTFHNYTKVKLDSYDFLSLEEVMTFHNVVILIKLVRSKDQNHYCYNITTEKA